MAFGILSGLGQSQVDMHGPVGYGLRAASFIPGPLGLIGTLGGLGVRANNTGFADNARPSWGQEGLSFGQALGGALGLNSYGQGGPTDRLGEYNGTAVAPGGMVSNGGIFGIGATMEGAYTPGEAQKRAAAAKFGSSFGTPVQPGAVAQAAPVQTQPAASQAIAPAPAPVQAAMPASAPSRNALGVVTDVARNVVQIGQAAIARALGNRNGGGNYSSGGGTMGGRGGYGGGTAGGGNRADGRSGADTGNRSSLN